jgi:putative permease
MIPKRQQLWTDLVYLAAMLCLGGLLAYVFSMALLPVLASCFIAYVLAPVVDFVERRGFSRAAAVRMLFAIGLTVTIGALLYFIPILADQMTALRTKLPEYSRQIQQVALAFQTDWNHRFPELRQFDMVGNITRKLSLYVTERLEHLPELLLNAFTLVSILLVIPLFTWYLLIQGRTIKKSLLAFVPNRYFEATLNLIYRVDQHLSGYLRAQLLDAIIVGLLSVIGYSLIGVQFSIVIGILAGVAHLIPYLGPVVGGGAAILVSLLEAGVTMKLLSILLVVAGVHLIDNFFIQPTIMSKITNLHPLGVLVILTIAGRVFGVWGLVFGIPIFCIGKIFLQELLVVVRRQTTETL